jgi:hypothetical protein
VPDVSGLAEHQRAMAAVVVTGEPGGDPRVDRLVGTPELALLREIGAGWQGLGLRMHCPLTAQALGRRGRWEAAVDGFARRPGVSEHLHVQSRQFLEGLAGHRDPLIAAVARFERSLLAADDRRERDDYVVIDWPCDPVALIRALAAGDAVLPDEAAPHRSTAPAHTPAVLTVQSGVRGPRRGSEASGQPHSTPGGA